MYIEVNGVQVSYDVAGKGNSVILLHGWGTNKESLAAVFNNYATNFKVYAIDFPGFGASTEPPVAWSVADYTSLLAEFINKLKIDNPVLLGHSFGGRVVINYAALHDDVNKVILVGSAGIKPKRPFIYYLKVYTFKLAKQIFRLPFINIYKDDALQKIKSVFGSSDYQNVSGVMQETLVKVVNEDLRHLLPRIKAPTLLIWGEADQATPVNDAKIMEKLIPDAGLVVFKNAAHYVYLDQLAQFLIVTNKFLEKDRLAAKSEVK